MRCNYLLTCIDNVVCLRHQNKGTAAMNTWTDILTADQLAAKYAFTATLDPRFAAEDRKFWESRTVAQLHGLKAGAWNCNEGETYQKARSYLALAGAAV
jgi:hypothetical protein